MSLPEGAQLGGYQIIGPLGTGGMGEVYRARDLKLRREVALKVLSEPFARDEERLARFAREALATSALNHPNILTVYDVGHTDDGLPFLAAELVAGETVRQRLQRGPMPLQEGIAVAIQVASALVAAHAQGVVHRDLKPDNIMIRRDGYVKVLDFGLAKLTAGSLAERSAEPTRATVNTERGMVLGTVAYMSPEQARGEPVDARTDIWSLGVVLFEMLTRRVPFEGSTPSHATVAILDHEPPPLARYVPDLPDLLQDIVSDALAKDRDARFQTAKQMEAKLRRVNRRLDANGSVNAASSGGSRESATYLTPDQTAAGPEVQRQPSVKSGPMAGERPRASSRWTRALARKRLVVTLACLTLLAAAVTLYVYNSPIITGGHPADANLRVVPFTTFEGLERSPAFSPDGRQLAYAWNPPQTNNFDIHVQLIGAGEPLRLTRHPGRDMSPAWSPDGRHIAFLRGTGESKGFYVIPALGGAERKVADAFGWNQAGTMPQALDWAADGRTLVLVDKLSEYDPWSLWLLSLDSGERRPLLSAAKDATNDVLVTCSPDGRSVAFARSREKGESVFADADIYVAPIEGGDAVRVTSAGREIRGIGWSADSREILFSGESETGESVVQRVPVSGGSSRTILLQTESIFDFASAPTGDRLAFSIMAADVNIWRVRLSGQQPGKAEAPSKLIASTRSEYAPQISPDGGRVSFWSDRSGHPEVWVSDADGRNAMQLTQLGNTAGRFSEVRGAPAWSPDGQFIAFDSSGANRDISVIGVNGGATRRVTVDPAIETQPAWSRDGHWIYFASNRTGRWEVWKISTAGGALVQLTRTGGSAPMESLDGRSLYYSKTRPDSALGAAVWRAHLDGTEETEVIPPPPAPPSGASRVPSWVLVKGGLYYIAAIRLQPTAAFRFTLHFLDLNSGRTKDVGTLLEPSGEAAGMGDLSVSPDGRWAVYGQRDRLESDLMLVENFR